MDEDCHLIGLVVPPCELHTRDFFVFFFFLMSFSPSYLKASICILQAGYVGEDVESILYKLLTVSYYFFVRCLPVYRLF